MTTPDTVRELRELLAAERTAMADLRTNEGRDDFPIRRYKRARMAWIAAADKHVPSLLDALEAADARAAAVEALLRPFAEAAEDLDDDHLDRHDIWESAAAMGITAGDLRAVLRALAPAVKEQGDG